MRHPKVTVNQALLAEICDEACVRVPRYEFSADRPLERLGTRGYYERGLIVVYIDQYKVGRIISANRRKRIEKSILATFLHEFKHHLQYEEPFGYVRMAQERRDFEYWDRPFEHEARSYARNRSKNRRMQKLLTIS